MAAENNISAQLLIHDDVVVQRLAKKRQSFRWQDVSECRQNIEKLNTPFEIFDDFRKDIKVTHHRSYDGIEPLAEPYFENWYLTDEYHFRVHQGWAHRQIEIWVVVTLPIDCYLLGVEVNGVNLEPELVHNGSGLPIVAFPYRPKSVPKEGMPITATFTFIEYEDTTQKKSTSFYFTPYYPPQ